MEFYLNEEGQKIGPFDQEQIAAKMAAGELADDDLVWHDEAGRWQEIQDVFNIEITEEEVLEAPEPEASPTVASPKQVAANMTRVLTQTVPARASLILVIVLSMVAGYFIGRAHMKHEIRSAFGEAFNGLADDSSESNSTSDSSSNSNSKPNWAIDSADEDIPQFMIGETYTTDGLTLSLTAAKVGDIKLKDSISGNEAISSKPALALQFAVTNPHDRKILRFSGGNRILGGNFKLVDDVDNFIRGIDYGIMTEVSGALTAADDIDPGSEVSHVEVFMVPPAKTKHLIVTIDLSCFEKEGKVSFKIPAESIEPIK